ncbi:histidine--tRNA ligase [Candidatus Shapirobacteria bacterium CG09_land_8_20_14_0_10_38_17]|uniref:Histidine--tRNA ligase n=1 Tax=Candidatus Shapirobacteria bacterium CG09_land_8_20_14_0_10_38_17 TaxID=1974884 RepID=A0A2H0WQR3_9BACT|nr:MAG: histidine--tRNA ligase [Candidatus Shapirobacteria bacterium CG09_land_8_20_14_0_10_38_17]
MVKKQMLKPCRGMRDFYPNDLAFRSWLYQKAREVCQRFGYQEYDGPIVESLSLYAAKSSEELIKKQGFTFLSKRDKKILVLRPELTPTLARMVAAREQELIFPLRWWSFGPFFRYESPQKGRGREFYQWNVDILGEDSVNADAEIIALSCQFLEGLGFNSDEVVVKINDRKYMNWKMDLIGIPLKKRLAVFRLIDKKGKVSEDSFMAMLREVGLSSLQVRDLNLALKDRDYSGESEWLTELFSALVDLGVKDWVEFDPTVVRGLDYYTDTVFEAYTREKGVNRALFGGGRYQDLVRDVGGKRNIGGVGLAAGDMVLEALLADLGHSPTLSYLPTQVLVTIFDEACFRESIELARQLRSWNIATELFFDFRVSLANQLRYANRKGIPQVVILGPKEIAEGQVVLRNFKTGEQKKIAVHQLRKECGKISL